jgi:hypothetical protein
MNRFGNNAEQDIHENVIRIVFKNTEKSKNIVWRQFVILRLKKSIYLSMAEILVSSI